MLILPDYNFPYMIEDVSEHVVPKYSWFYDVDMNDFMLKPIRFLEETIGATVVVRINNQKFNVPASWNLMVVDEETKIVDTVPIVQCSSNNYKAFMMHPETNDYHVSSVDLIDLIPKSSCVHVMIPRLCMMLHPVGILETARSKYAELNYSVLLSPQDLGKHLSAVTAMEILL